MCNDIYKYEYAIFLRKSEQCAFSGLHSLLYLFLLCTVFFLIQDYKNSPNIFALFAVPEGKPTITAAHNTSATSIYLAWKPPNRDTIHGEFLGYRIGYRRREKADEEMKNIYIRDPAVDVSRQMFFLFFINQCVITSY